MQYIKKTIEQITEELQKEKEKNCELEQQLNIVIKEKEEILEELRSTNEQFNTAIERTNKMALIAEACNITKTYFLSNMSHEFRTPLNAIIGMTNLVMDSGITEEQKESLDIVIKSANSLFSLLNDILTLAEIQDSQFYPDEEDFELFDTINFAIKPFIENIKDKGLKLNIKLNPSLPYYLRGDAKLLRRIINNLIDNAIKFSEKGEITFCAFPEITDTEKDDYNSAIPVTLHFSVTDTGIGISPDKINIIFDIFTQADSSTTRKYHGAGLGLTIAKEFTKLLNGNIWVESEINKGSTFHFTAKFLKLLG